MKSKVLYRLVFSIILLLIIPLVVAVDTPIGVETLPSHQVTLNILNPNNGDVYKSLEGNSSSEGIVSLTYTSSTNQKINIYAIIRSSVGKIVLTKSFEDISTGSATTLKVLANAPVVTPPITPTPLVETPKNITPTVNVTPNVTITNTTNTTATNASSNNSSFGLGSALSSFWNTIVGYAYILGTIIVILLLAFLLHRYWPDIKIKIDERRANSSKREKVRDKEKDLDLGSPKELINAEKKLKQLQEEIDGIKNKNRKVAEAERKFDEAKRELDRLKRD